MKRICILALAICLGAGLYLLGRENPTLLQQAAASGEMIRLHVVAASDDAFDQQTKLAARDAILEYFAEDAPAAKNSAQTVHRIQANLAEIESVAKAAATAHGYEGPVQASFGVFHFPEKVYAGESVPEGDYQALRVVLGDGGGANWWCVMYPPLCFIGEEAVAPGERVEVQFESTIAKWWKNRK